MYMYINFTYKYMLVHDLYLFVHNIHVNGVKINWWMGRGIVSLGGGGA